MSDEARATVKDEIIIAKDGIKRRLTYPFDIHADREAALHLAEELAKAFADRTYGWVQVHRNAARQSGPNHVASDWADPAPARGEIETERAPVSLRLRRDGVVRELAVPFDLCLGAVQARALYDRLDAFGRDPDAVPAWITLRAPGSADEPEVLSWG